MKRTDGTVRRVQIMTDNRGKRYAVIAAKIEDRAWAKIIALGSLTAVAANLKIGDRVVAIGDAVETMAADGQRVCEVTAYTLAPIQSEPAARSYKAPACDWVDLLDHTLLTEGEKAASLFLRVIAEKYGNITALNTLDEYIRRNRATRQ
jgi:hypothetical protein